MIAHEARKRRDRAIAIGGGEGGTVMPRRASNTTVIAIAGTASSASHRQWRPIIHDPARPRLAPSRDTAVTASMPGQIRALSMGPW